MSQPQTAETREEFEVDVTLLITTTRDDISAALVRCGLTIGAMVGEALVVDIAPNPCIQPLSEREWEHGVGR